MHMILSYPTGRHVEAILLSATGGRMRLVVRGQEETIELSRIGYEWISDFGYPVEIQSIVTDDPVGTAHIWSEALPRVAGAAS